MKELLWFLLAGSRGGATRARIILAVKRRPANTHQLAKSLHLDYKTVQHHLRILLKNQVLAVVNKGKYGATHLLSPWLQENYDQYTEIWEQFGNK